MSFGMQISDQTEEIAELNEKYKAALRDKVEVYDELVESLKELVNRNQRYMKNEIEMCKLVNETANVKRELELKEKVVQEMYREINERSAKDQDLMAKVNDRIDGKQQILKKLRSELRERDQDIEFMEFVLREKQRDINAMQSQILEKAEPKQQPVTQIQQHLKHKPLQQPASTTKKS